MVSLFQPIVPAYFATQFFPILLSKIGCFPKITKPTVNSADSSDPMKKLYIQIGETWAGTLYDVQRGNRNSPRLQRQKQNYTEQMGRTTIACLVIYFPPIAYPLLQWILGVLRPPRAPDTLFFDLYYTHPPLLYGPYGTFTILAGSIFLSSNLFSNFLLDDLKEGHLLALAHSGVVFLFIGSLFQLIPQIEINLSPPGPPFYTPTIIWMFLQNFKYMLLLIPLLLALLLWTFGDELEGILKDTTQLRLDSRQWNEYRRTRSNSVERPYIQTRLDSERWNRHIQTRLDSDRWDD